MGTVEVLAATAAVVFGLALLVLSFYAAVGWVGSWMWCWNARPSRRDSAFIVVVLATTFGYWVWLLVSEQGVVGQ